MLGRASFATILVPFLAIAAVLAPASQGSAQAAPSPSSCSPGALGHGFWNGDVCIGTIPVTGGFEMTDPARPRLSCSPVENPDAPDEEAMPGNPFTQPTNIWGNALPKDLITACVDAMYAAGAQWDMVRDWLGRNGIDGQGRAAPIGVGLAEPTAFFNDEPTPRVVLGAMPAQTSEPEEPEPGTHQLDPEGRQYTSMDVVAHEFGHLVFATTPALGAFNVTVEHQALNEGTADIFSQLTIAFANNPRVPLTYKIGGQSGQVLRVMFHPSLIRLHLDCYRADLFARYGHLNAFEGPTAGLQYPFAGPLNHWFFLLAEGSNSAGFPASPTCNGSTLTGLGIKTAGQIWYKALQLKTNTWKYEDARSATLTAAIQLFPGSCTVFDKIKAAWNAVSVPTLSNEPTCAVTPPTITPPTIAPAAPPSASAVPLSIAVSPSSAPPPAATIPATGINVGWRLTTGLATIVLGIPLLAIGRRRRRC